MSTVSVATQRQAAESDGAQQFANPLAVAWRRKALLALGVCVGFTLGLLYYSQATPVYQSSAQVLVVKRRAEAIPVTGAGAMQQIYVEDYLTTHTILIRSQELLRRAAKLLESAAPGAIPAGTDPVAFLSSGLNVTRENRDGSSAGLSNVLNLSFRGRQPDDCARVVSAIIEAYKDFLNETYGDLNKEFVHQMMRAQTMLQGDIQEKQAAHEKLVARDPLALKAKDSLAGLQERIGRLEAKRADLLLRQTELETSRAMIATSLAKGQSRAVILKMVERSDAGRQTGFESRSPDEALHALQLQEEELRQEVGKDHPQLVSLRRRIQSLRDRTDSVANSASSLDPLELHNQLLARELEQNQMMQKTLLGILEDERGKAREMAGYLLEEEKARKAVEPLQQLYDNVIARLQQIRLTGDSGGYTARTIVEAGPGAKVAPSLLQSLTLATALGLLVGLGLAYLAEWTDQGFHDPEEIRQRLGLPVMGHIPFLAAPETADAAIGEHLCVYHAPKSREAEAFRGLRTSLYFSLQGRGHQIIQMTSPNKGEGKSTLLANLAISIAQSGKSVVLVDADFRRPAMDKLFRLAPPQFGLALAMLGEVELTGLVRPSSIPGLSLIPCGPRPANPAELLTSPRFQELLAQLRERFDFVLVDTPPLLAVSDPAVVAPRVDGVLMALKLSKQCRPAAQRGKELLASLGANILGVVVNGIDGFRAGAGYGYEQGYGYGYGCSYGDGDGDVEEDEPGDVRAALSAADRLPDGSGNGTSAPSTR